MASLHTNLVSYWKFDESSGNAADPRGSNTLTNNNTATFASGKINNGADLELASTQYFSIADASQTGLDFSDAVSFAGWVKFESIPADTNPFIMKRAAAGNNRSYSFYLAGASNTLNWDSFTDGTTTGCSVSVSWTPSTATWYHVAVTKSGTTIKFYVNGAQQGTTQTGANGTIYNGAAAFEVGGFVDAPTYLDGFIDEWGAWSRQLTGTEISELYNAGTGTSYPFPGSISDTAGTPTESVSTAFSSTLTETAGAPTETIQRRFGYSTTNKSSAPSWVNPDKT